MTRQNRNSFWDWALLCWILVICLAGATVIGMTGCAKNGAAKPLPKGAINSYDATSYDVLLSAKKGIDSFKKDFSSLPMDQQQKLAPYLNQAIKDYNIGEAAWQAYHAGATGDANTLTSSLWQLIADLATLNNVSPPKNPVPTPTP